MLVTSYVARQLSIGRFVPGGSIERAGFREQLTGPAPLGFGKTSQKGVNWAAASCMCTVGAFEIIFCVHTSIIHDLLFFVKTKPALGGLAINPIRN
jgi:hypothetical protein